MFFKAGILFSMKMVHLYRNMSDMTLQYMLIKIVHFVGVINGTLWYKNARNGQLWNNLEVTEFLSSLLSFSSL